jgi:hypothetical protein
MFFNSKIDFYSTTLQFILLTFTLTFVFQVLSARGVMAATVYSFYGFQHLFKTVADVVVVKW